MRGHTSGSLFSLHGSPLPSEAPIPHLELQAPSNKEPPCRVILSLVRAVCSVSPPPHNPLTFLKRNFLFSKVENSGESCEGSMRRGGLPHNACAVKCAAITVGHCCSLCPLCLPEAVPWRIQFSGAGVGAGVWERQPSSHDLLCAAVGVQASLGSAPQFPDLCNERMNTPYQGVTCRDTRTHEHVYICIHRDTQTHTYMYTQRHRCTYTRTRAHTP